MKSVYNFSAGYGPNGAGYLSRLSVVTASGLAPYPVKLGQEFDVYGPSCVTTCCIFCCYCNGQHLIWIYFVPTSSYLTRAEFGAYCLAGKRRRSRCRRLKSAIVNDVPPPVIINSICIALSSWQMCQPILSPFVGLTVPGSAVDRRRGTGDIGIVLPVFTGTIDGI